MWFFDPWRIIASVCCFARQAARSCIRPQPGLPVAGSWRHIRRMKKIFPARFQQHVDFVGFSWNQRGTPHGKNIHIESTPAIITYPPARQKRPSH
jgi:hypothetical protein